MRKILLSGLLMSFALVASVHAGAENEVRVYTVAKGDTLWSISGKELGDSFLWPKLWKENPQVSNPDRLTPGQTITIPLILLAKETKESAEPALIPKPEIRSVAVETISSNQPPVRQELVNSNVLIASGSISADIPAEGVIVGAPSGRTLFGSRDVVFLKTRVAPKVGDKFYVTRTGKKVVHPVSGKFMGYLQEILGIAEVTTLEFGETKAKISQAFQDMEVGDLLATYHDLAVPVVSKPYRTPRLDGIIVATEGIRILNTFLDVVYIDKGNNDGIAPGDMFRIVDTGTGHKIVTGVFQVIRTTDTTSTGIIRESSDPIVAGNLFTALE